MLKMVQTGSLLICNIAYFNLSIPYRNQVILIQCKWSKIYTKICRLNLPKFTSFIISFIHQLHHLYQLCDLSPLQLTSMEPTKWLLISSLKIIYWLKIGVGITFAFYFSCIRSQSLSIWLPFHPWFQVTRVIGGAR